MKICNLTHSAFIPATENVRAHLKITISNVNNRKSLDAIIFVDDLPQKDDCMQFACSIIDICNILNNR